MDSLRRGQAEAEDRLPPLPGRGAVRGAVIGFVSVAVAVTLLATWTGYGLSEATVMGLFVGSWGGCGFGAMLGGTISFIRAEDRARAEALVAPAQELHAADIKAPADAGDSEDSAAPLPSSTTL